MRILVGHNFYQQPGGEDAVFAAETAMLEAQGHAVLRYSKHNDAIGPANKWKAGFSAMWNRTTYREIERLVKDEKPDVCHFHNTFPLISPSAFHAAAAQKVPVVLTLHNYRLLCPAAVLLRDGRVCEKCVGRRVALPGVVHACYHHSRVQTANVAAMLSLHRRMKTWRDRVDLYIALTEFARRKFIEGGLPAGKIAVKPNFVHPDPGCGIHSRRENFALFVGRLSPEKGIAALLRAWSAIGNELPLRIAGAGPMANDVRQLCAAGPAVSWLGQLNKPDVIAQMKLARVLIFPSIWYESLPLTILEAFATGLPVIASRLGSMPELVEDGRTGFLFEPGSSEDLVATVRRMLSNPERNEDMQLCVRREFENKYTRPRNCELLLQCYQRVANRQDEPECAVSMNN